MPNQPAAPSSFHDPIRIGFVTRSEAANVTSWSGTTAHMQQALQEAGARIQPLDQMRLAAMRLDKWGNQMRRRLGLPQTRPLRSWRASRHFARQIQAQLAAKPSDVLFSPAGSVLLAALETPLPLAYSSDATFRLLSRYYPGHERLAARSLREMDEMEQAVISRADLLIYPTEWVARSAIEDYGADPARIHVVPYGANLPAPPRDAALAARPSRPLQLLFIGVDWRRKGGDLAVATLAELNSRGIAAHMTVIGCTPPERVSRNNLTVVPFLDKNNPSQRAVLSSYYLAADLFLMPTRQECYGIVFCEAAAYGVPSITTATGGVPGVVLEDVTGRLLPLDADAAAFADAVEGVLSVPGGLAALRRRTRDDYEARLNWESWAVRVMSLMKEQLRQRRTVPNLV